MMIKQIYQQYQAFYKEIEQIYSKYLQSPFEWESLHLRYLLYYMVRYHILDTECFNPYHYRTAYRIYVEKLKVSGELQF